LTAEEKGRNSWGDALRFTYNANLDLPYSSSMPEYFPDLIHCHCLMSRYELPSVEGKSYRVVLLEGAKVGIHALAGFPSLHTLPYRGHLEQAGVTVFQQASKNDTMVITLQNIYDGKKTEDIAKDKIGKKVFVGWPYLREGKVLAVSDNLFRYEYISVGEGTKLAPFAHGPAQLADFERNSNRIEENYSVRFGVVIGEVEVLLHIAPLKGLRRTDEGAMVKDYAEGSAHLEAQHAIQTTVAEVHSEDVRYIEKAALPVEEEFPVNSVAFFLGEFNYGRPLKVIGHQENKVDIQLLTLKAKESVDFAREIVKQSENAKPYFPSYTVATLVHLKPLPLSKITSSFTVVVNGETRVNLGLSLKFEARRQKVLGYSRRVQEGWQFSDKALALIKEYKTKFPEFIAGLERNPHKGILLSNCTNGRSLCT
jgi:5'-3' exoribonuclease 1